MRKIIFLLGLLSFHLGANAQTVTFNFTGGLQTYTVPAGVTSITVDAQGAKGGGYKGYSTYGSQGGKGGRVQATIAVTPGHVLNIVVGGAGVDNGPGGYGGGGSDPVWSASWPGSGGGGYSGITDATSSTVLLVAGGGGGGGGSCSGCDAGGQGGGLIGGAGNEGGTIGSGGQGGNTTTGTGGSGTNAGAYLTGGNNSGTLGAGGGGYFGGGGGGSLSGGGGGGGSSYTNVTYTIGAVTHTQGYNSGNGVVVFGTPCTGSITGAGTVCVGASISLTDTAAGGSWSSSNTAVGTVGPSTGIVTGISTGTTIISYTTSCGSATHVVTVAAAPVAGTISGAAYVCSGGAITLSETVAGGTWSSSATSLATVSSAGTVTGVASGSVLISYTITNSCGSATATHAVSIDTTISAGTISGASFVCLSSTTTLSESIAGGIWSSSAPSVATISSAGVVSGVSGGTATISYTVTVACGSGSATMVIQVSAPNTPQICVVDLDSATGKNLVVWEKVGIHNAAQYNIYRLAPTSVFTLIASQASNLFSTFLDTGSYPLVQNYSYKMTLTDSCGNESDSSLSNIHTTIHLTSSLGVGGVVNLNWNVYVGKPVTTQNIMRSVGGGPYVSIGAVANTVTSYTDLTPPGGSLAYQIDDIMPTICTPSFRTTSMYYDTLKSNPVFLTSSLGLSNSISGSTIEIYPNPVRDVLHIDASFSNAYSIQNIVGQVLQHGILQQGSNTVSVKELPAGVYMLEVADATGNRVMNKIVKE